MTPNPAGIDGTANRREPASALDFASQYLPGPARERVARRVELDVLIEVEGGINAFGGEGYG